MAGQGSARVTLKEIDLSQVSSQKLLPQGVPAAVVGPARKGPAFVPQTFANMQQFSETFGNMLERDREANSNLFGPMALNQWMQNSQAGTYLRVLGVGDGLKATNNVVTDAGFVVGTEQVQSTNLVAKNPHATISDSDRVAAASKSRTHFLGCFMKDETGSNFLQESGIQTAQGAGSIKIRFTEDEKPQASNTLKFRFIKTNDSFAEETFTFISGNTADFNIKTDSDHISTILFDLADRINNAAETKDDLTAVLTPDTLSTKLTGISAASALVRGLKYTINTVGNTTWSNVTNSSLYTAINGTFGSPAAGDQFISTVTGGDGGTSGVVETTQSESNATLIVTSDHATKGTNTNSNTAEFNINAPSDFSNIEIGGKTASVASQTVNFGGGGLTAAFADIEMSANPDTDDNIEITALTNNGNATFTDQTVTYIFKPSLANNTDPTHLEDGDVIANVYEINTVSEVHVKIDADNFQNTLSNLKAAIKRIASQAGDGSGIVTKHEGNLIVSNINSTSFRITQSVKGTAGRSKADGSTGCIDNNATNVVIKGAGTADGLADDIADAAAVGFFKGGEDTFASLTIQLTGQPNVDDEISFILLKHDHATNTNTEKFIFKNNITDIAKSGNDMLVPIGTSLDETLVNLRLAIINSNSDGDNINASISNTYSDSLILNDADNSLTIVMNKANLQKGAKANLSQTVKVSDSVKFTNPDGLSVVGNFGSKTVNFSGGGGRAAPVIRGILMMPQGVKPTLDVDNGSITGVQGTVNSAGIANATASLSNIRSINVSTASFGINASDLKGYEIGDVKNDLKFKLILNGFKNEEYPAVYSCSFNPNDSQYFSKVLNTDPTKIEEKGHYLYANWDIDTAVAKPSSSGLTKSGANLTGSYARMTGFCIPSKGIKLNQTTANNPDYDSYTSRFRTAYSPYVVSQYYGSSDTADRSASDATYKLFRLHALDDGEIGNRQFRVLVSNLRYVSDKEYGSFDLSLEAFDSDPVKGEIIKTWKKLDLDVNSRNFIGRVIGDKHMFYNFDRSQNSQRLVETGRYDIKNKYVRVELSDDLLSNQVPPDALPCGFIGLSHLFTNGAGNFEESLAAANAIFTDATPAKLPLLSDSQVAPLPFVRSISKITGSSTKEAVQDLAWGIKFGIKKNTDVALKETTEIEFNRSIESWTKFFPDLGAIEPAWRTYDFEESATNVDAFQNNFFSLEKIQLDSAGVTGDVITNWGTATYRRDGKIVADASGTDERFVNISKDANGGNIRYLKFRFMMQGGFDGVNIFDKEKSALTNVAASREGLDETSANKFTGPTVMSYRRAVDVLSDKSATEFQVLCLPGLRAPAVTDYAITSAEDRFDALLIMDIEEKDESDSLVYSDLVRPHVRNTIKQLKNRVLDTSFAAVYFPDVLVRRPSDNAPIVVPPSVGMMGVLSRNDSIADPWFAPAGLQRGRLAAIDTQVQMNRDLLDELYDEDINPIYVPAGRSGEVYAFGQKTLLQNQSALDRINVRRLLIDIRRKVRKVGEQLLFEPNRESTLARFASLVEPIMQNVQSRRGVTRYKVQVDTTTTTQNDIENNTIRGKIYLQPTKSVEFISLDFVVANTIE